MLEKETHSIRVIGDYDGLTLSDMEVLSLCFHSLSRIAASLDYPEAVAATLENSAESFQQFKLELESKPTVPKITAAYASANR